MKSVMDHSFSQVPSAEIPRSSFDRSHGYKTTFDASYLIPVFHDEVMPGDTISINPTLFARLNTPIYPIMDNMYLDLHFFFVPYRQIWDNFRKFCGEQTDPGDSIDYTVPVCNVAATSVAITIGKLGDYFGLPIGKDSVEISALPFRAFRHIYNEWYRDQNLVDSLDFNTNDGPDNLAFTGATYAPPKRGKRHDYFTSCTPWLQKGDSVEMPLSGEAWVRGIARMNAPWTITTGTVEESGQVDDDYGTTAASTGSTNYFAVEQDGATGYPKIRADLSSATAATINELRQAFQIQRLLERDARSGTRYSEIVRAHFGVQFLDVTYRPEFLGGMSAPIQIQQVPQTSATGTATDAENQKGSLAAYGTAVISEGGITKSFTEHGIVLGILSARADLTYQQGLERMWSRQTRYDFYWPALAHLGEGAVLVKELYCQDAATDTGATGTPDNERVFGYQERWAEYRYKPSKITGLMRSAAATPLDSWHLSQEFGSLPSLNQAFIEEDPPMDRVVAVTTEPDFLLDCYFQYRCARPMPLFSVPGLIDHL